MAFFNLTHLGYQNTISKASVLAQECPIRSRTELGFRALPPLMDRNMPTKSVLPINQISGYPPGPRGSYVEFTRMRTKHTRNIKDPYQIYIFPITTSSQYGWFHKDEPLGVRQPWTRTQRYPQIHSEMTKFVDTMAKTDRHFSLF